MLLQVLVRVAIDRMDFLELQASHWESTQVPQQKNLGGGSSKIQRLALRLKPTAYIDPQRVPTLVAASVLGLRALLSARFEASTPSKLVQVLTGPEPHLARQWR